MIYDMIIVGAGPAGMTAAVYGQRAGKKTLLIDAKGFGGQILNTPEVENYPGIQKTSGFELASALYEQATGHGAEIVYAEVTAVEDGGVVKKVVTKEQQIYEAKTVILATGAKNRPLGLPEEEKFVGSGVSYCATCDGAFFRGKKVAVIGGGNTALEDAEVLSNLAEEVYLIHRRDTFRGEQAMVKRLLAKENVEFFMDSVPCEILGDTKVSGLKIRNVKTEAETELAVSGVFVAIGQMPANEAFADIAELSEHGYIVAGEDCLTKTAGIFVCGDCRTKAVRQLATAAADGAVAALAAAAYINGTETLS